MSKESLSGDKVSGVISVSGFINRVKCYETVEDIREKLSLVLGEG